MEKNTTTGFLQYFNHFLKYLSQPVCVYEYGFINNNIKAVQVSDCKVQLSLTCIADFTSYLTKKGKID